ncbi:MAG TPA: hypothetical protein VMZ06_18460 [Candidatus Bathyarchaeia archaeon]|nr:hypothetical protein [Candidatus Bathyarchaeia archaeon]
MARKLTPPPEPAQATQKFGCGVIIMVITLIIAAIAIIPKWWNLLAYCIPGVFVLLFWLYGKTLLLIAYFVYRPRGIVGVFITSYSPTWNEYVEKKWLEPYAGRFVVLNWSEKRQWPNNLASRLFSHFLSSEDRNLCPAVIFLRGLRYPLIFRFFYAFRDHKHGNDNALNSLEARLAQELEEIRQP